MQAFFTILVALACLPATTLAARNAFLTKPMSDVETTAWHNPQADNVEMLSMRDFDAVEILRYEYEALDIFLDKELQYFGSYGGYGGYAGYGFYGYYGEFERSITFMYGGGVQEDYSFTPEALVSGEYMMEDSEHRHIPNPNQLSKSRRRSLLATNVDDLSATVGPSYGGPLYGGDWSDSGDVGRRVLYGTHSGYYGGVYYGSYLRPLMAFGGYYGGSGRVTEEAEQGWSDSLLGELAKEAR
ncbi:hypothetical protein Agub_g3512 [Astrephomene gubernaculifera]|uniref:Uncharacterized protein n=1 Tax=Astrephomene gubernaculifera TaxID=47775 RepID=A0AAD3DIR5_9CHLO|nr:hypothetical protein Agub_g3512 [Astrephomene gubernaculifera]